MSPLRLTYTPLFVIILTFGVARRSLSCLKIRGMIYEILSVIQYKCIFNDIPGTKDEDFIHHKGE